MRIAYSYIRMSTDTQLKGDSLRRQLELSKAYAQQHNLNLIESLKGQPLQDIGISAFRGANAREGVLACFLQALKEGEIPHNSVLLVESLDRLSREKTTSALSLFLGIIDQGVEVVTLTDNQRYTKEILDNNPGSLLISIGAMFRANDESATKSKRISAAWENKRQKALTTPITRICPAWLTLDENRQKFLPIPSHAEVVKQIFTLCLQGVGIYAIAGILNGSKVPVFGRARYWHASYIKKILENKATTGEFQPKKRVNGEKENAGDPIKNYFPQIISEADFYAARAAIKTRRNHGSGRKGKEFSNIFSGLLYCGLCGSKMKMKNRGGESEKTKTFACTRQQAKSSCNMPEWKLTELESLIFKHIKEVDFSSLINQTSKNELKELEISAVAITQKIEEKKNSIDRIYKFISSDELNPEASKELTIKINNIHSEIESEMKALSELNFMLNEKRNSTKELNNETLKKLAFEIETQKSNYVFRAALNSALKSCVQRIEMHKRPFTYQEWEYDNDSPEVKDFMSKNKSRGLLSLNQIRKRKKFIELCELRQRHVVIRYKTGAVRFIDIESGFSSSTPIFNR